MTIDWRMLLAGATMMTTPAMAASPVADGDAAPDAAASLALVEDAMREDGDARGWRLDPEAFAPPEDEKGDLRWRVRVRPNRAMGRMSLSF